MTTISILKKLITIYFYLLVLGFTAALILFPIGIITNQTFKVKFLEINEDLTLRSPKVIIITILLLLLLFLFTRAIYFIKESLSDLANGKHFTVLVIKNFKITGVLLLICGVGYWVCQLFANLILSSKVKLMIDNSGFFMILMGLFFMYLSEVFKVGKKAKEENELTI